MGMETFHASRTPWIIQKFNSLIFQFTCHFKFYIFVCVFATKNKWTFRCSRALQRTRERESERDLFACGNMLRNKITLLNPRVEMRKSLFSQLQWQSVKHFSIKRKLSTCWMCFVIILQSLSHSLSILPQPLVVADMYVDIYDTLLSFHFSSTYVPIISQRIIDLMGDGVRVIKEWNYK
jgi:hypothetical protein